MIEVRQGTLNDVDAAVEVVRQSITQLCVEDHHNDEATVNTWLANKTAENFQIWITNRENFFAVAERGRRLSGVGLLHSSGEIRLFYVAPGVQRQGIGKAIHAALEDKAKCWGLQTLHLESTALACRFYETFGYHAMAVAKPRFGVLQAYRYKKTL